MNKGSSNTPRNVFCCISSSYCGGGNMDILKTAITASFLNPKHTFPRQTPPSPTTHLRPFIFYYIHIMWNPLFILFGYLHRSYLDAGIYLICILTSVLLVPRFPIFQILASVIFETGSQRSNHFDRKFQKIWMATSDLIWTLVSKNV